jgi:hypothetical protein
MRFARLLSRLRRSGYTKRERWLLTLREERNLREFGERIRKTFEVIGMKQLSDLEYFITRNIGTCTDQLVSEPDKLS